MIPVRQEPDEAAFDTERCCFCWDATTYWTNIPSRKPGDQVACCMRCAQKNYIKDVPSKSYWWNIYKRIPKEEKHD